MDPHQNLLLRALIDPSGLTSLSLHEWDALLPLARRAGVLARIGVILDSLGLIESLPPKVVTHLDSARIVAAERARIIRWEVNRIHRALGHIDTPVVLLKGGAYCMADLPPGRGRLSSDLDIMVPKDKIPDVESALIDHGWAHINLDPYDQRYYRTWMHELPPLQHTQRQTMLDVHHTILPESGRLHPDPQLMLEAAVPIPGCPFKALAPHDMTLHSAAHLFQDGDLGNGLRDLADLDDLFRHFGSTPGYWDGLVDRAVRLDLHRPLFYALRYTQQIMQTPIPSTVTEAAAHAGSPPPAVLRGMDLLVNQALTTGHLERRSWTAGLARWLLYVRSHWLRMPPHLLVRHLALKAVKDWSLWPDPQSEPQAKQ